MSLYIKNADPLLFVYETSDPESGEPDYLLTTTCPCLVGKTSIEQAIIRDSYVNETDEDEEKGIALVSEWLRTH
jgi:hypothetical protein